MKCLHCETPTTNLKFCSNGCQLRSQTERKKQDFLDGKYVGKHLQIRDWSRDLLESILGCNCQGCGLGKWYNGKPLTLQWNHKDGDATNNVVSNFELLCPNCHTQTENYGRKNQVSSRDWRRKAMLSSR
jgi:hypothetical protein